MQQMRRVRTVQLAAPEEALIRRGAILLEDALHVASLPETGGGRVLVIRSLHVGRINVARASAGTALIIEQRVRNLSAAAVHAEDPAAGGAPAVYFRDEVEAFILLAVRLALHADTTSWFWPLAVPRLQHETARAEGLRTVLYGSAETRAGPAATIALLTELQQRGAIEPLLEALRWSDGPDLLRVFRWSVPSSSLHPFIPPSHVSTEPMAAPWARTLTRWTERWGESDARTLWLAAAVLVAERPTRLLDARITIRAQRMLRSMRARATLPTDPIEGRRPRTHHRSDPAATTIYSSSASEVVDPEHVSIDPERTSHHDERADSPSFALPRPSDPRQALPGRLDSVDPEHPMDSVSFSGTPDTPRVAPEIRSAEGRPARAWTDSEPTLYAGLFLLLPALTRLGMMDMLASYPDLLEWDLPDRLLREVGRRLAIPAGDPVLAVPSVVESSSIPRLGEFVVPARWSPALTGDGARRLRRVWGRPGGRVLYDASGRMPLALWQDRAPQAAHPLLHDSGVLRDPRSVRKSVIALVLDAWIAALRRWVRLYGGLSLRQVVQRRGAISRTRTHLDVLFADRAVDIRIRRAGLDLDPGWIVWFGRVVSFHYLHEDDGYGAD